MEEELHIMAKKTISRRDFLCGAAAGAVVGAAATGLLTGFGSDQAASASAAAGAYKPGTYSATAQGINTVTVTMTVDADKITDVVIDVSGETEGIGAGLGDQFTAQILDRQSAELDSVSGATVTSNAVQQAAQACLAQAKGESVLIPVDDAAASSWRTAPDPIPDSEIAETIETEVAIVGFGYAGLSTLRALGEAGVNAVALESMSRDSWWTVGHDIGHINSKILASKGIPQVDPVEFVNNWMLQTHNKANPALIMKFAQHSGDAVDWYLSPVKQETLDKVRTPYWPETESAIHQLNNGLRYYPGGIQWWEASWNGEGMANNTPGQLELKDLSRDNLDYIEANCPSVSVRFSTKGVQLVKDGDRVIGVIAQQEDGSYIKILADRGVVLAGGGFGGNQEMLADLLPGVNRMFTGEEGFSAPFGRDGSAIQMGVWAGGRLEPDISSMNFDSAVVPDYIPGPLWVDKNGQRFQNEAFAGPELNGFFMARTKRGNITSIYDSTYPSQIRRGFPGHQAFDYTNAETVAAMEANFETARTAGAAGANGWYCADSIEELAGMIGVDAGVLTETVEHYNELCAAGVDTDFGKDPRFLNPVAEGPFFAHVTTPSLGFALVTTGGFVTTNDQQVLGEDYEPIPGLYATGNTCGMRFGPAYVTPIPGVSIGICLTLGRELGNHLASL